MARARAMRARDPALRVTVLVLWGLLALFVLYPLVSLLARVATEAIARIVDRAIQLSGCAAVVESQPLARLYRRIRSWRIAEGTTEVLRLTVARELLARRRAAAP